MSFYVCGNDNKAIYLLFIGICIYSMLYNESFGSIWLFILQLNDLSIPISLFLFFLFPFHPNLKVKGGELPLESGTAPHFFLQGTIFLRIVQMRSLTPLAEISHCTTVSGFNDYLIETI